MVMHYTERLAQRRSEANARNAERAKRTDKEQIKVLDKHQFRALRERAKLKARIQEARLEKESKDRKSLGKPERKSKQKSLTPNK